MSSAPNFDEDDEQAQARHRLPWRWVVVLLAVLAGVIAAKACT